MDDFLPMALQPQRACVTTRPVPLLKDFSSPVMGFGTCLCGEMLLAMAEAGFRTLYDATYCHHYGADSLLGFLELLDSGRPPGDEDLLTLEDGSLLAFPLNLDGLRFHGGVGREQALACLRPEEQAWVIGGAEIYALALPLAQRALVTEIDQAFEGDAHAPVFGPEWRETSRESHRAGNGLSFSFVTYTKGA